jgi:hypothetical protein
MSPDHDPETSAGRQGSIRAALPVPERYRRFAPGPGAAIADNVDAA